MSVSMQNIADQVGVSRSTVSFVLAGHGKRRRISEQTCTQILEVAKRLGFQRNELAASIKRGRSKTIAFIGGAVTDYHMKIIAGVNTALAADGYSIKIFDVYDGTDPEYVIRRCISEMIDGVIGGSLNPKYLGMVRDELCSRGLPLVLVDNYRNYDWCACVGSDDVTGGKMAVAHLAGLGRKRIGLVSVAAHATLEHPRNTGYFQGLQEAGLQRCPELEFYDSSQGGFPLDQRQAIEKFLRKAKPDALFSIGDPGAMYFLHVMNSMGIQIPHEIAMVGFADLDYAVFSSPPLTSIRQPFFEMGFTAAELLLAELDRRCKTSGDGNNIPLLAGQTILLPVELIQRDSTIGPPRPGQPPTMRP